MMSLPVMDSTTTTLEDSTSSTAPPPRTANPYGQQAGGTHPTGMLSCYKYNRLQAELQLFHQYCMTTDLTGQFPKMTSHERSWHLNQK